MRMPFGLSLVLFLTSLCCFIEQSFFVYALWCINVTLCKYLWVCRCACLWAHLLRALCSSCSSRLSMLKQQSDRKWRSVSLGRKLTSSNRGTHLKIAAQTQSGTTTSPHYKETKSVSPQTVSGSTAHSMQNIQQKNTRSLTRFLMMAFCITSKHCARDPRVSRQWHTSYKHRAETVMRLWVNAAMSASKFCINVQCFINIVQPRGGSDAALVLSTWNAASMECLCHMKQKLWSMFLQYFDVYII